jgi:hypothetical protein
MLTADTDAQETADLSPNWGGNAPRGGMAVMNRILKDKATVPLFFAQTLIQSLRDVGYNHTTSALCEHVDNRSWGLEAGLDAVLAAAPGNVGAAVASLTTTIATAACRERHRARLRRIHPGPLWPVVDQPEAIEARVRIEQIRRRLAPADWQLISAIATGADYRAMGRSFRNT